ncbi:MAG: hypothetical protein PHQ43_01230 [Dehalococcoidales bacterium]|nr:hypothetical protein [Dehalococcoidales bacterium]
MTKEWDELKNTMRDPAASRADASKAMKSYVQKNAPRSKPTLVTLRKGGGKTNAIPLDQLSDAMEQNEDVFNRVKRIVTQ